jgi:SAM-dependent methyltransferase
MRSAIRRASTEDRDWAWQHKPALRLVYEDLFERVLAACRPGATAEIGAGEGLLKRYAPHVIATDITPARGIDVAADAQNLPFADASLDNVVAVDALHHIEYPRRFFAEAVRVLRVGGRIILLEPAVTAGSYVFYKFFHNEDLDLAADPLGAGQPQPGRDPFDANQAIPSLLCGRWRARFEDIFPELVFVQRRHLSFCAYPLSGGFQAWSLLPLGLAPRLLAWERQAEALLGPWFGFRLLMVLERRSAPP